MKGLKNAAKTVELRIRVRRRNQIGQERAKVQQAAAVASVGADERKAATARRVVSDEFLEKQACTVSSFVAKCSMLVRDPLLDHVLENAGRGDFRAASRIASHADFMMVCLSSWFREGQGLLQKCAAKDLPRLQTAIRVCARTLNELLAMFPAAAEADAYSKMLGLAHDELEAETAGKEFDLTTFNPRTSLKNASRATGITAIARPQKSLTEGFRAVADKLRKVVGLRQRVLVALHPATVDHGVEMTPLAEDVPSLEEDISAKVEVLAALLRQWKVTIAAKSQNLLLAGRHSRTQNLPEPQPLAHVLVADGDGQNNSSVSITVGPQIREVSVSTTWLERVHTAAFGGLLCGKEPVVSA